jgi:ATP-dependent RNA helicase HelY
MEDSPAERFAAAKRRNAQAKSLLGEFQDSLPYRLDDFQVEGSQAIQDGHSVLVAAPTSAGKTMVGQFAAYFALAKQTRCFYTTPIKALSNQKFREFCDVFGAESVGLLTGDNNINGDAPIVVMTTEVLRNMLYENSSGLRDLSHVVMDEVHYLADRSRGAVWEEVIIHLPPAVSVVALSATVSNAEEFGDWLRAVRGNLEIVVEEHRPTPLHQHVIAGRDMFDLFTDTKLLKLNPDLARIARNERTNPQGRGRFQSRYTPSRASVIEQLARADMLPCITFIFSRAACDDAVQQCLSSGLHLTTRDEVLKIRGYVDAAFAEADVEELRVLGYSSWLEGLERGIAAHHAGLVPAFKEVVEKLFQENLIKVVFATETLALGINMPARSVVLEKLTKWNGTVHAPITPGEYTQLTGRAGRRGIDTQGHAVVVWHAGMDPNGLAGLASTRTYPLRSSFRPSYNMAINLIGKVGTHKARELLESSFAQFQADKSVVGLATQLRRSEEARDGYEEATQCHLGNFEEYFNLRRQLSQLEKDTARDGVRERRFNNITFLNGLTRGDIIVIDSHRRSSVPYVVLDEARDFEDPRPRVMSMNKEVKRLAFSDLADGGRVLGTVRIPPMFDSRAAKSKQWLVDQMKKFSAQDEKPERDQRPSESRNEIEISRLRKAMRAHPCHGCNDREEHARWYDRIFTADREIRKLESKVEQRTSSITREFDRICDVLVDLEYLKRTSDGHSVTPQGEVLGRIYSERDLLAAECLANGLWSELEPDQMAAVASMLVYESRRDDDGEQISLPEGVLGDVIDEMFRLWGELKDIESQHRTDYLPEMDVNFIWPMLRWSRGQTITKVLRNSDLQPGDFVRWTKMVIDMLSQISMATDDEKVSRTARQAMNSLERGIVAW